LQKNNNNLGWGTVGVALGKLYGIGNSLVVKALSSTQFDSRGSELNRIGKKIKYR
jgi:hypothetical protein